MSYTTTDQKVARFMEADYEKTGQWRTLNLNDVTSATDTDLTADQVNDSVLRLGDGDLIETVRATEFEGQRRVRTFGKLSEEGRLLGQSQ